MGNENADSFSRRLRVVSTYLVAMRCSTNICNAPNAAVVEQGEFCRDPIVGRALFERFTTEPWVTNCVRL
jgi:hypothetical protein